MERLEQKFWNNNVRPLLKSVQGLRYERIELKTGISGVPDVYYSYRGSGWIELKAMMTRESHPDHIDLRGWTATQRLWAINHIKCGAIVWLMVKVNQQIAVIYPPQCDQEKRIEWDHPAIRLILGQPLSNADREAFRQLLRSSVD